MLVFDEPQALARWRAELQASRVVMVPTMGYLHEGHLTLIDTAREHASSDGKVVLTIFVNPTQFGPQEDLAQYPRDPQGDLDKARGHGVDVVFMPSQPEVMYPSRQTWVEVETLGDGLCGASRPGHFRGVCTIVIKLWGLIRPDVAVFGEKDVQQLAIIRRMHADLFLCGEVIGVPTVRESDGLAMSSRNVRLTPEHRARAGAIPRYLADVRQRFVDGVRARAALLGDPKAALVGGEVEYVDLVDAENLQSISTVERAAIVALAVRFGGVRLIDHVRLAL